MLKSGKATFCIIVADLKALFICLRLFVGTLCSSTHPIYYPLICLSARNYLPLQPFLLQQLQRSRNCFCQTSRNMN